VGFFDIVVVFFPKVHVFPGDSVVFDAGVDPRATPIDVRGDVLQFAIIPHVTVKLSIAEITGVSDLTAPNLFAGFGIPAENEDARFRQDGTVNAIARGVLCVPQPMGIHEKVGEPLVRQRLFDSFHVAAFGQPNPRGFPA